MNIKHIRWAIAVVAVVVLSMMGAIVWASSPTDVSDIVPLATPGLDADKVDGADAVDSWAPALQRASNVVKAMSNGRINPASFPLGYFDGRYMNNDANEVGNADVPNGALAPEKISGTAWTSTNDGTGSGLDADLLDGLQGFSYRNASNINTGTLGTLHYSAYNDLGAEGRIDCGADGDLCTRTTADARYDARYVNAGTKYLSIPGVAFRQNVHDQTGRYYSDYMCTLFDDWCLYSNCTYSAPVFLPHGATLTSMWAYYEDNYYGSEGEGGRDVWVWLYRANHVGDAAVMAECKSINNPGWSWCADHDITPNTIDNWNYFYSVRAELNRDCLDHALAGVVIGYIEN